MTDAITSFGTWLRRRRKALDLTQDALASLVGCSKDLIVKIEGDARRPSKQVADLLGRALQLGASEHALFVRAARAELAADRLPAPTIGVPLPTLTVADTPAESPRLKSREARTTNLPAPMNELIGREQAVREVSSLLHGKARLVTLTGPGGSRKTRLALHVAAASLDAFVDGVFVVDLAPISDPALVVAAIAQAIGVLDTGSLPVRARLQRFVQTRELLLLLDNFEHLLAAGLLVAELLAVAPSLKVLATSRVALHLSGEHEYAVPPLALPPTTTDHSAPVRAETIGQYAAGALFVQRAQAAKADFAVTDATAPVVAAICAHLDGLPLAIELAAPWMKLFSPEALLARLQRDGGLDVLTGGPRDHPARQQTIRSALGWSYALLSADEQRLFRRLGVFVGGFALAGAAALVVADDAPTTDGLADVSLLLDHSLLAAREPVAGEPRFGMLELVREYALERLREAGEEAETRRRHAAYLLGLAEAVVPHMYGPETRRVLDQLEAELPNLRAAFAWFAEANEHDIALRLASTLLPLWLEHRQREGCAMLQAALSQPGAGPPLVRAHALNALGRLRYTESASWPETVAALEESLAIFRALGDLDGSAEVLDHLQLVAFQRGDLEGALALEEASLRDSRAARNLERTAWALQNIADLTFLHSAAARGSALLEESEALFAQLKHASGHAMGRFVLAQELQRRGDGPQAVALFREFVGLLRASGQTEFLHVALFSLGQAVLREGDPARAVGLLQECLAMQRKEDELATHPPVLHALGEAALAQGDHVAARARFRESQALCRELGNTWHTAGALLGEGHVALAEGDAGAAHTCYAQALTIFASLPDWDDRRRRVGLAASLDGLAGAAAPTAPERAARLCSAAAALRASVGHAALVLGYTPSQLPPNRAADERVLASARATLGEEGFGAAWAAGQALTFEQALAEASSFTADIAPPHAPNS